MAALSFVSMRVSKSICEKKNFFLVQSFLKLEVSQSLPVPETQD